MNNKYITKSPHNDEVIIHDRYATIRKKALTGMIVANIAYDDFTISLFLGRGLDIFEPYPKFTMGCAAQENRRCRAFSVTYTNQ